MKKKLISLLKYVAILYIIICTSLYLFQESFIFHPTTLPSDYQFSYDNPYEELRFKTADNISLHGLLFRVNKPKGLVFYLHGNGGTLNRVGYVAEPFNQSGYDVFMLDYRGYGKSEGKINSEAQLYRDNQLVYDSLSQLYPEETIIVVGYSIGSGMAAKLAATNQPRQLFLLAPYYNLSDMMLRKFPGIPTFILQYKFKTNKLLAQCKMPVTIFHGIDDKLIPFESSERLKTERPLITLIPLENQGHGGITYHPQFKTQIKEMLLDS